jgi:Na+/proline symporter
MPSGLTGILLASILAVAMSNASGSLNSLAASSVVDFAGLRDNESDTSAFLQRSRRMTLVWGAVLIGFGLLPWGHLLEAGLTVAALPFGSLLGLFFLGTFDSRANALGSLVGMFGGLISVLLVLGFTQVAFTWYVMIGSCVTFALGALVSRVVTEPTASS